MKEKYNGYDIEITYDTDGCCESPRDWDNLTRMVCFHGRYALGDKTDLKSTMFKSWVELKNYLIKKEKAVLIKPLYLYAHSGITISTSPFSCPWDSGQVGFVYVTRKDLLDNYNKKKVTKKLIESAEKILDSEVNIYDNYIIGSVFRYDIYDENGNGAESSCGLICNSEDDCWNEFESEIKSIIDEIILDKSNKV